MRRRSFFGRLGVFPPPPTPSPQRNTQRVDGVPLRRIHDSCKESLAGARQSNVDQMWTKPPIDRLATGIIGHVNWEINHGSVMRTALTPAIRGAMLSRIARLQGAIVGTANPAPRSRHELARMNDPISIDASRTLESSTSSLEPARVDRVHRPTPRTAALPAPAGGQDGPRKAPEGDYAAGGVHQSASFQRQDMPQGPENRCLTLMLCSLPSDVSCFRGAARDADIRGRPVYPHREAHTWSPSSSICALSDSISWLESSFGTSPSLPAAAAGLSQPWSRRQAGVGDESSLQPIRGRLHSHDEGPPSQSTRPHLIPGNAGGRGPCERCLAMLRRFEKPRVLRRQVSSPLLSPRSLTSASASMLAATALSTMVPSPTLWLSLDTMSARKSWMCFLMKPWRKI